MAETAKKAKKKKGKTLALNQFLANDGENGPSSATHAAVFSARSTSWADESENLNTEVDTAWPEESYGGLSTEIKMRAAMDRAALPTAPRAARGPDVDTSKIPDEPPFTAFLGNLSYDVDREDILEFFGHDKVTEVRLPQDNNGRLKGFGYAEFEDKAALLAALILNNEHLKNRRIRVDVAGQQHQERERGEREGRSSEPDRTDGDWRRPDSSDQNGFNDRERSYDDGPQDRWGSRGGYDSGPRDRSGQRGFDDGPPRDRSGYRGYDDGPPRDRSGFRGYDDGPRDRSSYRAYDDEPPRDKPGYQSYDDGPRDRSANRGYDDGPPRDRSGYRGYDDGPRDRSGYGRDRGYDDGPRGDDRYGDRDRGKGFGSGWDSGDRDRYGDRGHDDRGGYGRDRADNRRFGDRFGGDRDRGGGYGRDRYDDRRDRYDDRRDRYGGDRDRGGGYGRDRYDDRRYGDHDRYDDRRGGDRYGDRDRRRDNDEQDWNSWREGDRVRDGRGDYDREEREPVRERRRLNLQPRTKPVEENKDEPVSGSSVFGGAKPVDTAAKEREIEERLARQKLEDEAKIKQEQDKQRERRERDEWPRSSSGRVRRDSNRSSDGDRAPRERRDSSDYHRGRRDGARSGDEGTPGKDSEPRDSPRGAGKETKEVPKEAPKAAPKAAPPPTVNVWAKRMEQQKAASTADGEPKSPKAEEHRVEINVDSASMTVTSPPTSPDRKGFGKPAGPRKEFSGSPRGRGRGGERSSANGPTQERGGRGMKKEKRERKPAEPRKYEETPQPVFHTASKFSALLDDEDMTEQKTEQIEGEEET